MPASPRPSCDERMTGRGSRPSTSAPPAGGSCSPTSARTGSRCGRCTGSPTTRCSCGTARRTRDALGSARSVRATSAQGWPRRAGRRRDLTSVGVDSLGRRLRPAARRQAARAAPQLPRRALRDAASTPCTPTVAQEQLYARNGLAVPALQHGVPAGCRAARRAARRRRHRAAGARPDRLLAHRAHGDRADQRLHHRTARHRRRAGTPNSSVLGLPRRSVPRTRRTRRSRWAAAARPRRPVGARRADFAVTDGRLARHRVGRRRDPDGLGIGGLHLLWHLGAGRRRAARAGGRPTRRGAPTSPTRSVPTVEFDSCAT